jgi:hypothetical protein
MGMGFRKNINKLRLVKKHIPEFQS